MVAEKEKEEWLAGSVENIRQRGFSKSAHSPILSTSVRVEVPGSEKITFEDLQRKEKKKKISKLPYNLEENFFRISSAEVRRARNCGNRIKELKYFLDHDVEDPRNFPQAKRVLTESGTQQICGMFENLNSFKITPPIAEIENPEAKKKNSVQGGPQFSFAPPFTEVEN